MATRPLIPAVRSLRSWRGVMTAAAVVAAQAALALGCTAGPLDITGGEPQNPLLGMIAHWPFDDGVGNVALDRSGHAHNGAIVGGTWTTGKFGGALRFEPGTEVTVPAFPQAKAAFTVGLWARLPIGDFGESFLTLVSTEVVFSGGWEVNAKLNPGDTRYQIGYWHGPGDSDYFTYDCRCVTAQQWTHIASVVDAVAGTISFYKDGAYQGQTTVTEPIRPGSTVLYFGRWQMPGRQLTGELDDVVIYDRALRAQDVAALAAAPVPVSP